MQMSFDLMLASLEKSPRARRLDPQTSHDAAASAKDLAKQHAVLILGALNYGPACVDRIAAITKLTPYQVSKRMSELAQPGTEAIELTTRKVKGSSGRMQREWRIKPAATQIPRAFFNS
jgi:predicted ArsR family transcriptional regulator